MVFHILVDLEFEIAPFRHDKRVRDRFGYLRPENRIHLIIALEIELLMIHHRHAVRIIHLAAGGNAEQDILCARMFLADIMDIVRGNERELELLGEFDELSVDELLFFDAVILNFEEEIIVSEDIEIIGKSLPGSPLPFIEESAGNFALNTSGESDQTFAVSGKEFLVGSGLVIESMELGIGYDLAEIHISGLIGREKDEMIAADMGNGGIVDLFGSRCDIDFASDDGFDSFCGHLFIEFDCAAHDAVIGHRACRRMVLQTHLHKIRFLFSSFFILDSRSP